MSTDPDAQTGQAVARAITATARHTSLLVEDARALADVGHPSLCEGWTRGHVLTHVARNAEAIGRLVDWAVDGTPRAMYPGGTPARDAAIEEGARRSVQESVDDVSRTADALAPRLEALRGPWAVDGVEMRGGLVVSPARLAFLRLREVVFHHVDLDAGLTFAAVEEALLREFVDDAVERRARTPGHRRWRCGARPVRCGGSAVSPPHESPATSPASCCGWRAGGRTACARTAHSRSSHVAPRAQG